MSLSVDLAPILSQVIAGASVLGLGGLGRYLWKTSQQVHENQQMIEMTRGKVQELEEEVV